MKKTNPCYDPETNTDCPKRKGGCHGECKEWAEYCKNRNRKYKERLLEHYASTKELERKHRRF